MSTVYRVELRREAKWWMVAIPELHGLTQARKLAEAPDMAREYIALATDAEPESFEVEITRIRVEDIDVTDDLAAIRAARMEAAALDREASARAAALAKRLSAASMPVREIGAAMQISFQRAAQLIHS